MLINCYILNNYLKTMVFFTTTCYDIMRKLVSVVPYLTLKIFMIEAAIPATFKNKKLAVKPYNCYYAKQCLNCKI